MLPRQSFHGLGVKGTSFIGGSVPGGACDLEVQSWEGEPRLLEPACRFPGRTLRRTLSRRRLLVTTVMGLRNLSP